MNIHFSDLHIKENEKFDMIITTCLLSGWEYYCDEMSPDQYFYSFYKDKCSFEVMINRGKTPILNYSISSPNRNSSFHNNINIELLLERLLEEIIE